MKEFLDKIHEKIGQHRENLRLWGNGYLNPTEPDREEREAVRRELRAAIVTLEWVLAELGCVDDPIREPYEVEIVRSHVPDSRCCLCGRWDEAKWGVPVAADGPETGLVVANDYPGETAGKAACRNCWAEHEKGKHVGTDPRY